MVKGFSTYAAVFLILGAGTVATSWAYSNTALNPEESRIDTQQQISDLKFRRNNVVSYVRNSLYLQGMISSDESASLSGRTKEENKYRYWVCESDRQIPDPYVVSSSAEDILDERMKNSTEMITGIRKGYIHQAKGFNSSFGGKPVDDPDNDSLSVGGTIEKVVVTDESDGTSIRHSNVTVEETLQYNRYWYTYETMREFVKDQNFVRDLETRINQEVRDGNSLTNTVCGEERSDCQGNYPEAFACKDVANQAHQVTTVYLNELSRELETSDKYFGGENYECRIDWNEKEESGTNISYPGIETRPISERVAINTTNSCILEENSESEGGGSQAASINSLTTSSNGGSCTPRDVEVENKTKCESTDELNGEWSCEQDLIDLDENCEMGDGDVCESINGRSCEQEEYPDCQNYGIETCSSIDGCQVDTSEGVCEQDLDWDAPEYCAGTNEPDKERCEEIDGCENDCECQTDISCPGAEEGQCGKYCEWDDGGGSGGDNGDGGGSGEGSGSGEGNGTELGCSTRWQHQITSFADFTLECTDNEHPSIPGSEDDLENLNWEVDVSFEATSTGNSKSVECEEGCCILPNGLKQCNIDD